MPSPSDHPAMSAASDLLTTPEEEEVAEASPVLPLLSEQELRR